MNHVDLVTLVEMPEWKSILLDLVRKEEMDPWDIDLVVLSTKYLEKIREMRANDLVVPANALLACAILLNMKARVLDGLWVEEQEEEVLEYHEDILLPEPEEMVAPEENVVVTTPVVPPHKLASRKITLDELLTVMEKVMKAKKTKKKAPPEEFILPPLEEPEDERVDELVHEVYEKINETLDSEGLTTFSRILPENTPDAVITYFLPVLYLATEGKIRVWQEKPFDEIFIAVVEDGSGEDS